MTIKSHFNLYGLNPEDGSNNNEQTLIKDLVAEAIQMYGIDVQYLPRTLQKEDTLFGEDILSSFDNAYTIEMYIQNVEGYEGEGEFLKNFGLSVGDQGTLVVSSPRFTTETTMAKPLEGDLIYFPLSKGLFEIKFVEDEKQFYPAGSLPQYVLTVELFTYSSEDFNTTIPEIDIISDVDQDPLTAGPGDPSDSSDDIESEAASFLDFSEDNPWGNY